MARPWFPSLIWLLAVLLSGKLSAQLPAPDVSVPDSWVGTYSGTGLVLEIRQNASGGLAGSITFQNKRYVAIVMAEGDKLEGAFRTADDFFPYQATRNGNEHPIPSTDTT